VSENGRCSVCAQDLTLDSCVTCVLCSTVFHYGCILYQRRCAVYGCGARAFEHAFDSAVVEQLSTQYSDHYLQTFLPFVRTFLGTILAYVIIGKSLENVLSSTAYALYLLLGIPILGNAAFASGIHYWISESQQAVDEHLMYLGFRVRAPRLHPIDGSAFMYFVPTEKFYRPAIVYSNKDASTDAGTGMRFRILPLATQVFIVGSSHRPDELAYFCEQAERLDMPILFPPRDYFRTGMRECVTRIQSRIRCDDDRKLLEGRTSCTDKRDKQSPDPAAEADLHVQRGPRSA
jgi:multidrug transporter EmrE-like cation transporter